MGLSPRICRASGFTRKADHPLSAGFRHLKKPNSPDVKSAGDKQRKATFAAEPLERRYGLTLGPIFRLPAVRAGTRRGGRFASSFRTDPGP